MKKVNTKKIVKRKKIKIGPLLFLIVIISLFMFLNFSNFLLEQDENLKENDKGNDSVITESSLSLIMVGDCLIHGAVYSDAKTENGYDFNKMVDLVKPIIEKYDLAFYNQESILGGTELGLSSYPAFNSPQEVGDAFINMGFNLVSLANNHTLDRGKKAIYSSLDYWKTKESVLTAGSYYSEEDRITPKIKEKNGITYALLSYTTTTNGIPVPKDGTYLISVYNEQTVKEDIERLREQVDLLLVSMHWGEEYTHTPNQNQIKIAEYLASLGVDIIIGHHPHVVQPIDFIGDTMVIYSLGNFISSQYGVNKLTGLMAGITVKKVTKDGVSVITLENPTAQLVYTYSEITSYRHSYRLYPYKMLNNDLLSNYQTHYEKYMGIVTSMNSRIIPIL